MLAETAQGCENRQFLNRAMPNDAVLRHARTELTLLNLLHLRFGMWIARAAMERMNPR